MVSVRLLTNSLYPPEIAKNNPRRIRTSRIAYGSSVPPISTDRTSCFQSITRLLRVSSYLFRQLGARLLCHHVGRIPVRPILVALTPHALFVFAVGGRCAPKRARQVAYGSEGCRGRIDAAGQSGGDLLQQPAVAVGIAERGEGAIAAMLRVCAADSQPSEQVRLVRAGKLITGVEHFADRGAVAEQFGACRSDVRDDQVESLGRARSSRGNVLAEDHRAPGARRRELNDPEVVGGIGVGGVEPPTQSAVELLGAVDVGNRYDDDLELQVDTRGARVTGLTTYFVLCLCHVFPRMSFA